MTAIELFLDWEETLGPCGAMIVVELLLGGYAMSTGLKTRPYQPLKWSDIFIRHWDAGRNEGMKVSPSSSSWAGVHW